MLIRVVLVDWRGCFSSGSWCFSMYLYFPDASDLELNGGLLEEEFENSSFLFWALIINTIWMGLIENIEEKRVWEKNKWKEIEKV